MRTQTISALSGEREWLAGPVDPSGWLSGPPVIPGQLRTGPEQAGPGLDSDVEPGPTSDRPVRRAGRVGRSAELGATRVARARRLRRVRSRSLANELVGAVAEPAGGAVADPVVDGYRMGRWARLALTVTVVAAAVVVIALIAAAPASHVLVDVTVGPGDSLWSIATEVAPERDPRAVIEEIRDINGFTGDVLPIGVVLRVPSD